MEKWCCTSARKGAKKECLNARWEKGVFVGIQKTSNEVLVSTMEGIEKVRTVKRIAKENRWGEQNVNMVRWAPWRRYKDAVEADGDLPEGVPVEEQSRGTEGRRRNSEDDLRGN